MVNIFQTCHYSKYIIRSLFAETVGLFQAACHACFLPPSLIHQSTSIPFNETDRLNERYVKFRPTELQRIAGEVVQQDYCPDSTKFAEGGFNKVFLLRANNGREEIARIPTPIAGPPHYTTASEVATRNFLRSVLKLPVPEVLLIQQHRTILSEQKRVKGESLSSRWLSLTTDETKDIMKQIADIERKIFDFHFPTTLTGKPRYQSWRISVSALYLLGSFGIANEVRPKLTVDPVRSSLSVLGFRKIIPITKTKYCQGFHSRTVLPPRLAERWLSFSTTLRLSLAKLSFYRLTMIFFPLSIPRYFRDSYNWRLI
ncbi:hypothetical protein N7445_004698 [Penicillium cf. griseofulvum]|nr:hypothetical protein N7445_004698 [Penicillium cf. griseofulvum]